MELVDERLELSGVSSQAIMTVVALFSTLSPRKRRGATEFNPSAPSLNLPCPLAVLALQGLFELQVV